MTPSFGTGPGQWGPWAAWTPSTAFDHPRFKFVFDRNIVGWAWQIGLWRFGISFGWIRKEARDDKTTRDVVVGIEMGAGYKMDQQPS